MTDSTIAVLKELFSRDLNRLKKEMLAYQNEKTIWIEEGSINNSAGNLCLHLIGNLRHFIGTILGETSYIRKRELEFSSKNIPVSELIKMISETEKDILQALDNLTIEKLKNNYPIEVFRKPMTTEFFLMHLCSHLNYHLGQINYHRRILIHHPIGK